MVSIIAHYAQSVNINYAQSLHYYFMQITLYTKCKGGIDYENF